MFFSTCFPLKCFSPGFDLLGCLQRVDSVALVTEQSCSFCTVVFRLGRVLEYNLSTAVSVFLTPADSVVST